MLASPGMMVELSMLGPPTTWFEYRLCWVQLNRMYICKQFCRPITLMMSLCFATCPSAAVKCFRHASAGQCSRPAVDLQHIECSNAIVSYKSCGCPGCPRTCCSTVTLVQNSRGTSCKLCSQLAADCMMSKLMMCMVHRLLKVKDQAGEDLLKTFCQLHVLIAYLMAGGDERGRFPADPCS